MRKMLKWIGILLAVCVAIYLGLLAAVCYMQNRTTPRKDGDCLVVLGAQVLPDGSPSVQLRYRLQTALESYRSSPCLVIVCGAQGADEPMAEGDAMRLWLMENGVPESDIVAETASTTTQENLAHAKLIMEKRGLSRPNIVTSDYHLPRALAYAKDAGLIAGGIKSPCKPGLGFWLKNHLREALAWVKYLLIRYVGLSL